MQKEILTQLAILRVGSCANNLPWPYDWLLFCRCDWCDSGCWGKQIKTCQCSRWTDVDGGFDVSLDDSFCNVFSFSFPNIEYFICCFETQIFAISSQQIFLKMFQNMWTTGWSGQLQSTHVTPDIFLSTNLFCGKFFAIWAFWYYDSWWDIGGMKSKTGGIHPTSCCPKPRPTTLAIFLTLSLFSTKMKSVKKNNFWKNHRK